MACPTCGTVAPEGARFCPSCGRELESRSDERRIATVLFADIVGFTSLSETMDPEQVKNLVDRCFQSMVEEIEAFGGVVDKIIGDAIVALFGAPVAHEDDPERAVRAALQMQARLSSVRSGLGADVRMRIGVNTGEVLVGALRAGGDYTAMGDVVNTAQRLQAAARPGTVLVGETTHAATNGVIRYETVPPLDAKGKERPVLAFEAHDPLLPPGYRRRRHTPLIGRDAEVGLLRHAVDTAVERERANVILLLGEAGVGKTRLAEEVAELAVAQHQATVFEGRCVPYGEANPWWPVAEALRQACGIEPGAALEVAESRTRATVVSILGTEADASEVSQLTAGLLHLLGYKGWLRDLDPTRAREESTLALLAFVERAAALNPVVLVLSDLHWADPVVVELVEALMDHVARSPVVLIATARPDVVPVSAASSDGRFNSVVLTIDPLAPDATAALLDELVDDDLPREVRSMVLDRSGGNPFFLEELVALVEGAGRSSLGRLSSDGATDLPETLRGLVSARLDALSPHEKHVLEDAAVWGRNGPVSALEIMARHLRGEDEITPVLASLGEGELLLFDGPNWEFRSDLVRDVAYTRLTKADRAVRHFGIATYLEHHHPDASDPETLALVAHHYGAAAELRREMGSVEGVGEEVEQAALDWIARAADAAKGELMLRAAERLYTQALPLVPQDDLRRRSQLLAERAAVRAEQREIRAAHRDVDEAGQIAGQLDDLQLVARAIQVKGELHGYAGEPNEAITLLHEAADRWRALDEPTGVADSLRALGLALLFSARTAEAETAISEAQAIFRELGDRRGEAWCNQQLAWISFVGGRTAEAEGRLETAQQVFLDTGDRAGLAWARGMLAFVRFQQGHLAEALELADEILPQAEERGERWAEAMMLVLGANVRLWLGRPAESLPLAETAVAKFVDMGDEFGLAQAHAIVGRALITLGRVDEGFFVLDEAGGHHGDVRDPNIAGLTLTATASAATQVGDPHRALAVLEAVDAPWVGSESVADVERNTAQSLAYLQLGESGEAERVLALLTADETASDDVSAYALAALALTRAARGGHAEVLEIDARVRDLQRATYLDRAMSGLAAALVFARARDEAALGRVEVLVEALAETDDHVFQAVTRLARAYVHEALGRESASVVRSEAERRLDELAIDVPGWRNLFELILTARPASAPG